MEDNTNIKQIRKKKMEEKHERRKITRQKREKSKKKKVKLWGKWRRERITNRDNGGKQVDGRKESPRWGKMGHTESMT